MKKTSYICTCMLLLALIGPVNAFGNKFNTIMLDPAGHAGSPERKLHQGYERAQTLAFAEALKQALVAQYGTNVMLSRSAGEEIAPLQIASFANRLNIDFFMRIHICKSESPKPQIYLYQYVQNPLLDFTTKIPANSLIPLDQAHVMNIHASKRLGQEILSTLSTKEFKKKFDIFGPIGLPIAPLTGITAPALLLEIGIDADDKWQTLVGDIAQSTAFLAE